eukprot:gene5336-5389_t
MRKISFVVASLALALGIIAAPHPAQAYWRGHFGFYGPGIIVGPPVIYAPPPPVYYAPPPPVYYAPAPAGQTCYAGPYICPLDRPTPAGGGCSCPANNGRVYGTAR